MGKGKPEAGKGGGGRLVEPGGDEEEEGHEKVADEEEEPGVGGEWLENGKDVGRLPLPLLHQDGQAVPHERNRELHVLNSLLCDT